MDYAKITPLLVKGMQDQQELIKLQNEKISSLEKELESIKATLSKVNKMEKLLVELKASAIPSN